MITEIREIKASDTLEIRHTTLWPDMPPEFVKIPADDRAFHFGLFCDGLLVSVISLFPDGENIQFRKFATTLAYQGKGLGSQLLNYAISFACDNHYTKIWCNARASAMAFYERFGFSPFSTSFMKENVEYFKIEKVL